MQCEPGIIPAIVLGRSYEEPRVPAAVRCHRHRALILAARVFLVPKDFGVRYRGVYVWLASQGQREDWKKFKVKYQGRTYCKDCHDKNYGSIKSPSTRTSSARIATARPSTIPASHPS